MEGKRLYPKSSSALGTKFLLGTVAATREERSSGYSRRLEGSLRASWPPGGLLTWPPPAQPHSLGSVVGGGGENVTKCRLTPRGECLETGEPFRGPVSEFKGLGRDLPRKGIWHISRPLQRNRHWRACCTQFPEPCPRWGHREEQGPPAFEELPGLWGQGQPCYSTIQDVWEEKVCPQMTQ